MYALELGTTGMVRYAVTPRSRKFVVASVVAVILLAGANINHLTKRICVSQFSYMTDSDFIYMAIRNELNANPPLHIKYNSTEDFLKDYTIDECCKILEDLYYYVPYNWYFNLWRRYVAVDVRFYGGSALYEISPCGELVGRITRQSK